MKNNLPILYVLDASVAVTGAFIAARNEARALADVFRIVLVLPQGSTIAREELSDFWRVDYLPIVSLSKTIRAAICYAPALFYASWRLFNRMNKEGATRLQLNDFYLMHGVLLRLFGFKGYIASWVRCDPKRFAGSLTRPMLWCARKSANRIVAVSSYIQSLLPPGYVDEIIYDYYSGTAREPEVWKNNKEKTFVYVGNYIEGKGQDVAIRAFTEAAKKDASLRLVFHGGDMGLQKNRDYLQRLRMLARESGMEGRIHFGDFLHNTFPVLEKAFAALNFSNSESFSMTVLEASGAGLPVIATASGGPQEIIKDGVTGFIIAVGDEVAATECILKCAQNIHAAATMGLAGAEHIRQSFSQESFRAKLQKMFGLSRQ